MRRAPILAVGLVFLFAIPVTAKDKSKSYQTGKLVDMSVTEVNRGIAMIGGMAAPIPGHLYQFEIESRDLVYFTEYSAGKLSYQPQWVVNDPLEFRLEENRMFLKRPDGRELEVHVTKRVRPEPAQK